MKSTLAIIFLIALSLHLSAQCEYEINGMDELEKVQRVQTKDVKVLQQISNVPSVFMALGRLDTSYYIKLNINVANPICLGTESELSILSDSSEVIKLRKQNRLAECSHSTVKGRESFETIDVNFLVPKEKLISLSKRELKKMKITSNEGNLDLDFVIKNQNKNLAGPFFKESTKCVLK